MITINPSNTRLRATLFMTHGIDLCVIPDRNIVDSDMVRDALADVGIAPCRYTMIDGTPGNKHWSYVVIDFQREEEFIMLKLAFDEYKRIGVLHNASTNGS